MTKKLLLLAASVMLLGASCIQVSGTGSAGNDGGLWKSGDKGAHWAPASSVVTVGSPKSFSGLNVTKLAFDPSDAKAIYAGTASGMFYSYDSAASWTLAGAVGAVGISGLAIHPTDKCTVYVGTSNRISRTRDCSRTWDTVYVDSRPTSRIVDVAADFFNPTVVYAATSAGDLLKSADNGNSWSAIKRFDGEIGGLVMSHADSRVLWVVLKSKGIWKSTDAGANWTDLTPEFGAFANALVNVRLIEDRATPNAWLTASNYGVLRTTTGGDSWKSIPLLTPAGSTVIYSLAVNPKNSAELWYGTANTLYHSVNAGAKWTTARLPTSRAATDLMVDPSNENVLYMGTTQPQKKQGL